MRAMTSGRRSDFDVDHKLDGIASAVEPTIAFELAEQFLCL